MKTILLFGAGKSATCLIDFLLEETQKNHWQLIVADGNAAAAQSKIGTATHARAMGVDVRGDLPRRELIQQADLVISLLPPFLHILVARDCVDCGKNLLTASYVDPSIRTLEAEIQKKGLFFLCEMGLDPGIDHMSAMQILDGLRAKGARFDAFRSHTGGLVAPESDDNPWHYKISWNPRNVVLAGSSGAVFREDGQTKEWSYAELFEKAGTVEMPGLGTLAYYPNRDSLGYIPIYHLEESSTFLRTTLRYPSFCKDWLPLVKAGLTDDKKPLDPRGLTFQKWSAPLLPWIKGEDETPYRFLGLLDDVPIPQTARNSADVLQCLLETRLKMEADDRDMIVMLHEIDFFLDGKRSFLKSSLLVKGQDSLRTAMAKTVGLPLGIAASLVLQGKIGLQGLHIPILPEIYRPVMDRLKSLGIRFQEEIS